MSYSFAIYLVHPMILEVIVSKLSEIGFDWNNLLFYPSVLYSDINFEYVLSENLLSKYHIVNTLLVK